jgi:hypothetical protein
VFSGAALPISFSKKKPESKNNEYDMEARKMQIKKLNFRWAAGAGAGFASVTGSIAENTVPKIVCDKDAFNADGTISPHIVREPRNETCLSCHAKPGWKKRGANFRSRTDIHLRAGFKCVDCHPAGKSAEDDRIRERNYTGSAREMIRLAMCGMIWTIPAGIVISVIQPASLERPWQNTPGCPGYIFTRLPAKPVIFPNV